MNLINRRNAVARKVLLLGLLAIHEFVDKEVCPSSYLDGNPFARIISLQPFGATIEKQSVLFDVTSYITSIWGCNPNYLSWIVRCITSFEDFCKNTKDLMG